MYQHLTKLLLAGVVAVILSAAPANAFHKGVVHGGGGGPGEPVETDWRNLTNVPPGFDDDIDNDTLSALNCLTAGDIAKTGYPLHSSSGVWRSESAAPMMVR
jgi:hypothetical protein